MPILGQPPNAIHEGDPLETVCLVKLSCKSVTPFVLIVKKGKIRLLVVGTALSESEIHYR